MNWPDCTHTHTHIHNVPKSKLWINKTKKKPKTHSWKIMHCINEPIHHCYQQQSCHLVTPFETKNKKGEGLCKAPNYDCIRIVLTQTHPNNCSLNHKEFSRYRVSIRIYLSLCCVRKKSHPVLRPWSKCTHTMCAIHGTKYLQEFLTSSSYYSSSS